ncbi:hypothetical protein ACFOY2_52300 [Nonomuraea purpurea]|uniref:Uncharacterized protein n=1 Tax=Nonomuraea purpurea TaxID=1849276 RepID=A0ABV8GPJ4_9ACTN
MGTVTGRSTGTPLGTDTGTRTALGADTGTRTILGTGVVAGVG